MTRITHSEEETSRLAAELAQRLRAGDVVALFGGLGAGKTAFVRGLAAGLGLDPRLVSSPTFALVNEYRSAAITLCHFDMYRVMGEDSLESTGFFDYLRQPGCILAVEWSENILDYLPDKATTITLERGEKETDRIIKIDVPEL